MKNNELFDGLSEEESDLLIKSLDAQRQTFSVGQNIYCFGGKSNKMGFLESGKAQIKKLDINGNEILLENLKGGSVFGNMLAFLGRDKEVIGVYAETKCEIIFIPYENINLNCSGACEYRHKFIMNLFRIISNKSSELSERIEIISNRTIREKLMCYIVINCGKEKSDRFRQEMTLSGLAEYICVDRSAMMREIKKLKEEGIIDISNKMFIMKV